VSVDVNGVLKAIKDSMHAEYSGKNLLHLVFFVGQFFCQIILQQLKTSANVATMSPKGRTRNENCLSDHVESLIARILLNRNKGFPEFDPLF